MKRTSGLVYSSETGRACPKCGWPLKNCQCSKQTSVPSGDGIVRISRETKGRKGKGVSIISGVPLAPEQLVALGKELKKKCGAGGTVRDGVIEIQGDHRDALVQALEQRGWKVRKAGG